MHPAIHWQIVKILMTWRIPNQVCKSNLILQGNQTKDVIIFIVIAPIPPYHPYQRKKIVLYKACTLPPEPTHLL